VIGVVTRTLYTIFCDRSSNKNTVHYIL